MILHFFMYRLNMLLKVVFKISFIGALITREFLFSLMYVSIVFPVILRTIQADPYSVG